MVICFIIFILFFMQKESELFRLYKYHKQKIKILG
jgi:hypothetical protein